MLTPALTYTFPTQFLTMGGRSDPTLAKVGNTDRLTATTKRQDAPASFAA